MAAGGAAAVLVPRARRRRDRRHGRPPGSGRKPRGRDRTHHGDGCGHRDARREREREDRLRIVDWSELDANSTTKFGLSSPLLVWAVISGLQSN